MKWQDKISSIPTTADTGQETEAPAVIMLITGTDAAGNAQWAYAQIPAQNYMPFKAAEAQGNYDLSQFGEVLKSGKGAKPPADIVQYMAEQYGCTEDFEDSLSQMLQDAAQAMDEIMSSETKENKN